MEANSTSNAIEDVRAKFEDVRKLLDDHDKLYTESEPYKIKYQAIEMLKSIETDLNKMLRVLPEEENEEKIKMLAVVNLNLGLLHADTEEFKAGEVQFMKSLKLVKNRELEPENVLMVLSALNQLGIIWSEWDQPTKARDFLLDAEKIYNDFINTCKDPCNIAQVFGIEPSKEELCPKELLERIHTLTLYYLAQIYSTLKDDRQSAIYCHMTLCRQLNHIAQDFNYIDWALNAATLSQYFMENNGFSQARHHLAAASYMLQKYENILKEETKNDGESEALSAKWENFKHRSADVARCWAKYGVLLMSLSKCRLLEKDELEELNSLDIKDTTASKIIDNLKFDCLEKEIEPIANQITDQFLLDFDDARSVFLNTQKWLEKSKEYYTLESHASDYVSIIKDFSNIYRYLTFFEENEDRQAKMHKRRIDILENLIKELNPQYYGSECRQIWYELGETYSAILDIKIDRIQLSNEKPTAQALTKLNNLARSSIKNFESLINSIHTRNSNSEIEQLPDEAESWVLFSYFYLGRLYNKFITPDKKVQLENTETSFNAYKYVVDYCEKYPKAAESLKVELKLSEEFVNLLPFKIKRLREDT